MKRFNLYLLALGLGLCHNLTLQAAALDKEALIDAIGDRELSKARELIHSGAVNLDEQSSGSGYTALAVAAMRGHDGLVDELLAAGANPNLATAAGATPLILAASSGHLKILERLLQDKRTDLSHTTSSGHSALSLAKERGQKSAAALLEKATREKGGTKGWLSSLF